MKLIALAPIRNTHKVKLDTGHKTPHERLIPKGAIFTIGESNRFEDLNEGEARLISQLASAEVIGDANDEKLVKRTQAEARLEAEVEARQAAPIAAGSTADVIAQLVASGVLIVARQPEAAGKK